MTRQQSGAYRMRAAMHAAALCLSLAGLAGLAGCSAFHECITCESPADAKISAEVRSLLAQEPALDTPNLISLQTLHGVVYLRGLVSTPYQIAEAGSVAARAKGVTGVQNLLSIDNSR